jgi:lysocardiolipin and lysophospholipid acyltransferase
MKFDFRAVRGITFGLLLWFCTVFGVSIVMVLPLLLVWSWSVYYYNRVLLSYSGWWFTWIMTFFEKFNGAELVFTGDDVPDSEPALITSNHPSEIDWLWFWSVALRKKMAATLRIATKKMLLYVPGLGWAMDFANFVFLSRDWRFDRAQLVHSINLYKSRDGYPFWLFIFPEGTDFAQHKLDKSHAFAREHGLPVYKNLLLPRFKGFLQCLESCGTAIAAVYDVTIAYEEPVRPNFLSIFIGTRPQRVHLHVRRFKLADLPTDAAQRTEWLYQVWRDKDALLDHFKQHKRFPARRAGAEPDWRWPLTPLETYGNFYGWCSFAALLLYWLFTSRWFFYLQVVSFTICIASYFDPVRRFRRLSPPLSDVTIGGEKAE